MSCGLPMVIYQPIPGQEERNSDFLLENGAAVKCNQLATMAYKVDLLLKNPERMAKMRRRAFELSHPDAAKRIVQQLIDDFYTEAVTIPRESTGEKTKAKLRRLGRKLSLSGEDSIFKIRFFLRMVFKGRQQEKSGESQRDACAIEMPLSRALSENNNPTREGHHIVDRLRDRHKPRCRLLLQADLHAVIG